jgi:hypothetical protein
VGTHSVDLWAPPLTLQVAAVAGCRHAVAPAVGGDELQAAARCEICFACVAGLSVVSVGGQVALSIQKLSYLPSVRSDQRRNISFVDLKKYQ